MIFLNKPKNSDLFSTQHLHTSSCVLHSGRLTDGSSTHTVITAELGTFGYGDMENMAYINNNLHFTVVKQSKSVCFKELFCLF